MKRHLFTAATLAAVVTLGAAAASQTRPVPRVDIDPDDIGGVVTGASGPEAGVWVIAETTDLPTKFAKIVVTDEQGRYLLPDLPKANYLRVFLDHQPLLQQRASEIFQRGRLDGNDVIIRKENI